MDELFRMAPVDRTDDLWCPPSQILLQNLSIVWARFQKIPKSATLGEVHDKIQMRRRLKGTKKLRCPFSIRFSGLEKYIALEERKALLEDT